MARKRCSWNSLRLVFWITGIIAGSVLTYFTRYYLNTDGLIYIEIGDAVRQGNWSALVNHHWSPAYSVIMAGAQFCLNTTPLNELPWLKIVNFLTFLFAMAACDFFLGALRHSTLDPPSDSAKTIPISLLGLSIYGAFFVATLVWIRIRLVAPDMLVFALILIAVSILLRIKRAPQGRSNFFLLGCILGIAYLTKTYMFLYSMVVIVLAALAVANLRMAVVRVGVALVAMMAVSLPFIIVLTGDLGRFTYGEAGNYNYAVFVDSQGDPLNPPERVTSRPEAIIFEDVSHSSFAPGADIAKRYEGRKPRFDLSKQINALAKNLIAIVSDSPWFFAALLLWNLMQLKWGRPKIGTIIRPSTPMILLALSFSGILLFSLVLVEMRYVAPFLFLGLAGSVLLWQYEPLNSHQTTLRNLSYYALGLALIALTLSSVIDQSRRAIHASGLKPSYEALFRENLMIARFIQMKGYSKGEHGAVIDSLRAGIYWARLAGVRIVAEIPSTRDFIEATSEDRAVLRRKLNEHAVKFVIGKGSYFHRLLSEGWEKIPSASGYYLLVTHN